MVILTLRKITWRVPAFNAEQTIQESLMLHWLLDRACIPAATSNQSWSFTFHMLGSRPNQSCVCALQHLCLVWCQNAGWDCWSVIFSALTDVLCSVVVGVGWLDHISHGPPASLLFMPPYRRVRFSCNAGPKESPINVSLGYTNTPWRWVNLRGNQGSDMWMECGYQ